MMVIELLVPRGALSPDQRTTVAERLGALEELVPEEERHAGIGAVFQPMFHVVVLEADAWVAAGRSAGPDRKVFLVRIWVPGPWRKDMSEHMIGHVTHALEDLVGARQNPGDPADPADPAGPAVLVHVLGVPEGGIGFNGQVRTSTQIVDLMGEPYEADLERGSALKDPMCGVIVPLNDHAVTLEADGTLYAFCCAGCRQEYVDKQARATAR